MKAQNKHLGSGSKSTLVLWRARAHRDCGSPKNTFLVLSLPVGKYDFFRDVDLIALVLSIMPNHGLGDFLQIACKILKWEALFYYL